MLWLHGSEICHAEHTDKLNIIGHTPHLEHWLRGIEEAKVNSFWFETQKGGLEGFVYHIYNLTKDGENQSEEFYKAYCEIVGISS